MPSTKARHSPSKVFTSPLAAHDIELREAVIKALDDLKALDLVCLDLTQKASFADFMIIASGTSSRHLAALADAVIAALAKNGQRVKGVEGKSGSDWVCVDADALVIHLFTPPAREHYRLEKLWSFPTLA
jgi:ribosome-associated protein